VRYQPRAEPGRKSVDTVVFEALYDDVHVPTRATTRSAGYDLRVYTKGRRISLRDAHGAAHERSAGADGAVTLHSGEVALLPLGFKAQVPSGYEAQIRIRSSWAFKRGLVLPNAPGTIDADYPDEWMVLMKVVGAAPVTVEHGDRVAQAVLTRYDVLEWIAGRVAQISNRAGGLGSTG
jgi:dUTP pyrophosphatase